MTSFDIRLGDRLLRAHVNADGTVRVGSGQGADSADGTADADFAVARVGDGLYRVGDGTRNWTVAVAGPNDNRWVHVDGQVAKLEVGSAGSRPTRVRTTRHELSAPMPATVIRVLAQPGSTVKRGDTLIMLEAMKMELPIRAPRDGVIKAVHCKAGELVQPGLNLLDLE